MDETRTLKDEIAKAAEVAWECQDLYEFHQGIGEPPTVLADTDTAKALGEAARTIRALLDALLAQPPAQGGTCLTCRHDTDYAECKANWRRPISGVYWKQQNGCRQFAALPTQDKETR